VGETVTFDGSWSIPNSGQIAEYKWSFADGGSETGQVVNHIFTSLGFYAVTLNVTDSTSLWNATQKQVQVVQLKNTLTVDSSPIEVTFTVDSVAHTTPWSDSYVPGTSVSLAMPETYDVGEARYYWNRWSDGTVSRQRTVNLNTDINLIAYYTGPSYCLTVTSLPLTAIPFTINTISKTTPYTEWLPEGSYNLEMPQTYNGYVWSRWLEDGDTNRIKTIYLHGTTWTGVYTSASPPTPPVGGEWVPIDKLRLSAPLIIVTSLMAVLTASFVYVKRKRLQG